MNIKKLIKGNIISLRRPIHGGDIWRYGNIEDFSSNVNPLGYPEKLKDLVLEGVNYVKFYPDDSCRTVKEAIADTFDVPLRCLMIGSGVTELIRLVSEVFINCGDHILIPRPTFEEYSFCSRILGGIVKFHVLDEKARFHINFDLLYEQLDSKIKVVFICNPNNPTSIIEEKRKIIELTEECERNNTVVVIDEALIDFIRNSHKFSCIFDVESYRNLIVLRSLTKALAVPGLRIGFCCANHELIKYLDKARLSWNINVITQSVIPKLLEYYHQHVNKAVKIIDSEKKRIYHMLFTRNYPISAYYPDANFFFVNINNLNMTSTQFKEEMLKRGILVRDCTSFGDPYYKYTRFAIKTPEKNELLLDAIKDLIYKRMG